jgi:WD40 repeat protein
MRLPVVPREAYQILAEHARGAIGRILRAKDKRLGRVVAIKELRLEHGKEEERFVREALLTARLEHPSIVPVHEAGRWPTGEPFIAMKLVTGRSLDELLKESQLLEQRVPLLRHVLLVAEAIAYAHSIGIIHRDLKPANVLVGSFGETVVIDWGLAKDMQEEPEPSQEHTPTYRRGIPIVETEEGLTMLGEVMGTPAYMPPEQARGLPCDERADVYSLGAILYHVLSGSPPYEGLPTEVVKMVARELPIPLERRQKGIPPDLLAIVKKAMARSPTERYRMAKELADDLRNYTAGAVVRAHTYTAQDRAVRFLRRNKPVVAVGGAAAILLLGIGIYAVRRVYSEADRAAAKQREAENAQDEATARADDLVLAQARSALDRDPNKSIGWLKRLSPKFTRWNQVRLVAAEAQERGISRVLRGHTAAIQRGLFLPDGTLLTAGDDKTMRAWPASGTPRSFEGAGSATWDIDISSLGTVVSGGRDGAVRTWNPATGENHVVAQHGQGVVRVAITRDGRFVVSRGKGEYVRVTELKSGLSSNVSETPSEDTDVALSPDGKRVAFVVLNRLVVRSLEDGSQKVQPAPGHVVRCSTFSPDGAFLATGTVDGLVRVWDVRKGTYHDFAGHTAAVVALAYTPTGTLVSASVDRTVRLWDAKGEERVLRGHDGDISSMRLSPDGAYAVTASADHTVRIWDLDGGESEVLRGFDDVVAGAAFSPDGARVAGWGWDQTVRMWNLVDRGTRVLATHESAVGHVAFAGPDVVASSSDKSVQIAYIGGGRALSIPQTSRVLDLSASRGIIAASEEDGTIRLLGVDGHERHVLRGHTGPVGRVIFSPDGARLASASADRTVQIWDVSSGQSPRSFQHDGEIKVLAFSPDGKRLATGGTDRFVRVWDAYGASVQKWTGHAGEIVALAFSPDGQTLVSGASDRMIARWDSSGRAKFIDTAGGGSRVAFVQGGAFFATAGADPALHMWDAKSGESGNVMRGHAGQIVDLAVSPDGRRVATASTDTTLRLWDLEAGASRKLALHGDAVTAVAYSPDGHWIASASTDRTVRLWADTLPDDGPGLRAWIDARDASTR